MAIREGVFDVCIFGLLFVSPFIDRWLATARWYLTGAFSASLWALLAYMSMWEICRRSPLRRYRSLESLATALAASTVGLVFCLRGHDSLLVELVLSIGLMMGALMAAIAVVACFLDWKLSTEEWAVAGLWCVGSAAVIAYLTLVKSPAAVAAVTQGRSPFESPGAQEQALLLAGILPGVLLALLVIKQPQRLEPTLGLLATVAFAIGWGWLCSQGVLLATEAGTPVSMGLMVGLGLAAWMSLRVALPTETSAPSETADATPSLIWLGPFALTLYRVFDSPRYVTFVAAIPSLVASTDDVSEIADLPTATVELESALEPSAPPLESAPVSATEAETTVPPSPGEEVVRLKIAPPPLFSIIFPPRLAERLFVPAVIAALMNLLR